MTLTYSRGIYDIDIFSRDHDIDIFSRDTDKRASQTCKTSSPQHLYSSRLMVGNYPVYTFSFTMDIYPASFTRGAGQGADELDGVDQPVMVGVEELKECR